jgi:hypothetical protein
LPPLLRHAIRDGFDAGEFITLMLVYGLVVVVGFVMSPFVSLYRVVAKERT